MIDRAPRRSRRIGKQLWIGGTALALIVIGALAYEYTFSGVETSTVGETEAIVDEDDPEDEYIFVGDQQASDDRAANERTGAPPVVPPGAITSVEPIVHPAGKATMTGRPVALTDLLITRVVGYQSFLAAPLDQWDQQILIVMQGSPRADGMGQDVDVRAGQRVSVYGTLERLGDEKAQELGIQQSPDELLEGRDIYVAANRLDF